VTTLYETELREQPDVVARILDQGRKDAETAAAHIRKAGPRFAVLAARGSSDNAARYAQYLFGIENALTVALAAPSVFTRYHARPSLAGALVVGISQSGQSPDIVEVVRAGREQGAVTVAVTNERASPLAEAAELLLPLHAGQEKAVAATKTYTAQLTVLAMLSAALRDDPAAWSDLARLPGHLAAAIAANEGCIDQARDFGTDARCVVVGRGYHLSTAFEITLKVKETSGVMADGYSSADFLHGPKALLAPDLPVLAVAPGRVFDDLDEVVRLARESGARVAAISDRAEILQAASAALPIPAGVPEWLSPIVAVVPGQLWALGLALARGMHPDTPRGLTKVTHTR
jgi:glucosamine--fructose-6-phosphate aminotransferase (isomerizing)